MAEMRRKDMTGSFSIVTAMVATAIVTVVTSSTEVTATSNINAATRVVTVANNSTRVGGSNSHDRNTVETAIETSCNIIVPN